MKKILSLFVIFFGFLVGISADENKSSDVDVYVLRTGMDLSLLKINDDTYFSFYGDIRATVLEITPMKESVCKMVIAVPWNRAGSFQNYVIYLKTGDVIQMYTGSQVALGLVGAFEYNKVPFVGITN